ncbi:hypothetical protein CDCA_CDCA06G1761 [Cyanidium caldarium]|uniref:Ribosome biogenesis regulatory protein n=1 Tax=Cyanidium caldarium TaxID=2771 RepID=A0AAV9IUI2_CYACA|nr:hypothetical protein CDCA_CDCA06G1761 [Cyanidium caldarium]
MSLLDLGHLEVLDTNTLPDTDAIVPRALTAVQSLVDALFQLPVDAEATGRAGHGRVVRLPPPQQRLPREKPLPELDAPLTKWERFAREKGIQKRKRERMVWDAERGEWRPRHGGGRARPSIRSHADEWVIEDKGQVAPGENPFRRKGASGQRVDRAQKWRSQIDDQLAVATRSTASLGKFDVLGARERQLQSRGKRRQYPSNTPAQSRGRGVALEPGERGRALRVAEDVLQGK